MRRENNLGIEKRRFELHISPLWILVALSLAVLLLVVAPGRGAPLVDDDGLFLDMSWQVANGFGLNLQMPQAPSYLVNAALMTMGVHEILYFRYINYVVILLSSTVFFLGADRRRWGSPIAPLAVCASLFVSLDAIQNPNSLALAFFLMGAGLYFFASDTSGWKQSLLLVNSGLFFALCGFMHAAVALAMVLIVTIALVIDPSLRRKALWPVFLIVSILLWGIYLANLGLQNFLTTPAAHDASLRYLLFRVTIITWFYVEAIAAYLVVLAFLGRERRKLAHILLIVLITLFYGANLVAYIFQIPPPNPFPLHGVFLLSKEGQWISRLPGALAYYLLLFTGMRWLTENWSEQLWKPNTSFYRRAQVAVAESFNAFSADVRARKWTIAVFGFVLLQASAAAGSDTSISQGMVFLAGPTLGFSILMWGSLHNSEETRSRLYAPLVAILVGFCVLFTLAYNHPTHQPILSRGRMVLHLSPLHGIYESPRYNASMAQLLDAYRENGCSDKVLITLVYTPLLYYIFQHPIPKEIGVLRPALYYPEDKVRAVLDPRRGWCVFDATDAEITQDIAVHGQDRRESLRRWLIVTSDRKITTPSVNPAYMSDIKLYIRKARSPALQ